MGHSEVALQQFGTVLGMQTEQRKADPQKSPMMHCQRCFQAVTIYIYIYSKINKHA